MYIRQRCRNDSRISRNVQIPTEFRNCPNSDGQIPVVEIPGNPEFLTGAVHGTNKFLPRKGRTVKITNQQLNGLVKAVSNKTGISQRQLAKRYPVHRTAISRTLGKRTPVVIRKRRKAPKMESEEQEKRARIGCGKLHRMILVGVILFWMMRN